MENTESRDDNDWMRIDRLPAPLRSQVVANLRAAITEGIFLPGDRLVERALCEQLQVSRPSIREAIRQLEAEGLLEVVPHRGPVVRSLSKQDAAELFDLCAHVEGLCARYFAERGSPQQVARYEAALDAHEKALLVGDRDAVRKAKNAYYEAFVAGSGSELVQTTLRQLNARLSQCWATSQRHPERISRGIKEMRQIVKAIRTRDAEAAYQAAVTYVQHANAYVQSVFDEDQPAVTGEPAKRGRTAVTGKKALA
jgi:DNA-binding GntR family transcriptional regulator